MSDTTKSCGPSAEAKKSTVLVSRSALDHSAFHDRLLADEQASDSGRDRRL